MTDEFVIHAKHIFTRTIYTQSMIRIFCAKKNVIRWESCSSTGYRWFYECIDLAAITRWTTHRRPHRTLRRGKLQTYKMLNSEKGMREKHCLKIIESDSSSSISILPFEKWTQCSTRSEKKRAHTKHIIWIWSYLDRAKALWSLHVPVGGSIGLYPYCHGNIRGLQIRFSVHSWAIPTPE